ncbi:MAG: phospholipase D family protein [Lachnospiraceae bacterium]|nr:phospholipase D family protein [Lachnospiraceae bacterium]
MEQLTLFDFDEGLTVDASRKLQVVQAKFIQSRELSWQELFDGFDEMYVITFSSGLRFMEQLIDRFDYTEIIFGCEGLVDDSLATIMAVERALVEKLVKSKSAIKMSEKMDEDKLMLYVSRDIKSHEKIFCLKSKDGRKRVITGSANMSSSAFCGIQRENISYYDDEEAYAWYKHRFEEFKDKCSDNVNQKVMTKSMEDEKFLEEHPEEIPVLNTLEKRNVVFLEQSEEEDDDIDIVANIIGLEKELKPMLPKPKKADGKIMIVAEQMKKFYSLNKEHIKEKREKQKTLPKLHIDYDANKLFFNGKECNLFPSYENIESDITFLFSYFDSLNTFYGDVKQAQKDYYAFLNWYFASLFMPYLRYVAYKNGYDVTPFPVVGIIYGESNGGKSTFLRLLSKLMCNTRIPLNSTGDFTTTNIEGLKRGCEGIPINIDDLDKAQFQHHAGKIIKDDEWGVREHFINYPAIAITTNKLPSLEAAISKRAIGCRINAKIDKEAGVKNSKRINESMRNITNSLYCEYVRRILPKIDSMVEEMKAGNDEYFPDIFKISSNVLIEIFGEFVHDKLPSYVEVLSYSDYFGEKVVGRNAINKILNAWENERKQFTVDKKKNKLVYTYPEGSNTYELRYICDELPPKLNASVASRCLVMDLDVAREFFEVRFKRRML